MSRSIKKTPIFGIAGNSDKKGKQEANRKFRRKEKSMIKWGKLFKLPMRVREVFNAYSMPKDGKTYLGHWKFDKEKEYEKIIRK